MPAYADITGVTGSILRAAGGGVEVWYRWQAPAAGNYLFSLRSPDTAAPVCVQVFAANFTTAIGGLPGANSPCGLGYEWGGMMAFSALAETYYTIKVFTQPPTAGGGFGAPPLAAFRLSWKPFLPLQLGDCSKCPPDWASENCVSQITLDDLAADALYSFGRQPAGIYKVRFCGGAARNVTVFPGQDFYDFQNTLTVWRDDRDYVEDLMVCAPGSGFFRAKEYVPNYNPTNPASWEIINDDSGSGGYSSCDEYGVGHSIYLGQNLTARALITIPPHAPYCGEQWEMVNGYETGIGECSETKLFCHAGGEIGVAYPGHALGDHNPPTGMNPTFKLIAINSKVPASYYSRQECGLRRMYGVPPQTFDLFLWLHLYGYSTRVPFRWNILAAVMGGNLNGGAISFNDPGWVGGRYGHPWWLEVGDNLLGFTISYMAYGTPSYPLVVDLVLKDDCSGQEVARYPDYTFTPVVTIFTSNPPHYYWNNSLGHGSVVQLVVKNDGNAPIGEITLTATATGLNVKLFQTTAWPPTPPSPATDSVSVLSGIRESSAPIFMLVSAKADYNVATSKVVLTAVDTSGEVIPPLFVNFPDKNSL